MIKKSAPGFIIPNICNESRKQKLKTKKNIFTFVKMLSQRKYFSSNNRIRRHLWVPKSWLWCIIECCVCCVWISYFSIWRVFLFMTAILKPKWSTNSDFKKNKQKVIHKMNECECFVIYIFYIIPLKYELQFFFDLLSFVVVFNFPKSKNLKNTKKKNKTTKK